MDKYARGIKLRLTWWITWWSLVTLAAIVQLVSTIDLFRHSYLSSEMDRLVSMFWLVILATISLRFIPSIHGLLSKDLKKNPENVYAKSMLLERQLQRHREDARAEQERDDLAGQVKVMEEELSKKK
jgi:hypothetical protein